MFSKKPRGLGRFAFRLPICFYRLRLGWVLGTRFLLLTHIGRKSGQHYQTVIEVIRYDKSIDTYMVVSGFGQKSDWYCNIKHNPDVVVTVGTRTAPAQAECLSNARGALELRAYAQNHPIAFRLLSRLLFGKTPDLTDENLEQLVELVPVVAFHCS